LCRYGARPAFAHQRLAWTADGQIAYRLKRPWPDGRTELVLPPVTFLRRLCGIIPPPRRHLVRYAGLFGPASYARAKLRALVPARGGAPPPAAATPSGSTRAGRVAARPSQETRSCLWGQVTCRRSTTPGTSSPALLLTRASDLDPRSPALRAPRTRSPAHRDHDDQRRDQYRVLRNDPCAPAAQ